MMELNNSMTGGGGCMSAVRGYEDFELDGKRYRVYGGLNGMTPREYVDSWGKPLTNGDFKRMRNSKKASSPPKPKRQPKWSLPENPTRRQPSRSAKERMTKGGKRKSHKGHKNRKSHKSHKSRK